MTDGGGAGADTGQTNLHRVVLSEVQVPYPVGGSSPSAEAPPTATPVLATRR